MGEITTVGGCRVRVSVDQDGDVVIAFDGDRLRKYAFTPANALRLVAALAEHAGVKVERCLSLTGQPVQVPKCQ